MIFHNILQKNPNELFGQPIVYKIHYIQIFNCNQCAVLWIGRTYSPYNCKSVPFDHFLSISLPTPSPGKRLSTLCSVSSALWAVSGTSSLVPRIQHLTHLPSQLGWCPLGESYTLFPSLSAFWKCLGGNSHMLRVYRAAFCSSSTIWLYVRERLHALACPFASVTFAFPVQLLKKITCDAPVCHPYGWFPLGSVSRFANKPFE